MATSSFRVKILFITANSPGWPVLDLEMERRKFQEALERNRYGDRFEAKFLFAAEVSDILQALRDHQPTVVHLSGHGDHQGALYFSASNSDDASALSAEGWADKLQIYQQGANWPVRLMVLAVCGSATAARLAAQHVDCAIGMNDDVGDEVLAALFTPSFYAALAHGENVQTALASAKNAMIHDGRTGAVEDAEAVQLFSRDGVDPAKVILSDLGQPPMTVSPVHRKYLDALFKERWATVKMKLFGSRTAETVDLLEIYSPLPVNFALTLKLDENDKRRQWWCSRGERESDGRQTREPWEQMLIEQADRLAMAGGLPDHKAQPRAWADLQVDESALEPLVDIAYNWAHRHKADRRRAEELLHWQAEAEHAALVQRRFVLIGDPGSGKSTFLRSLALSWAARMLCAGGSVRASTGAHLNLETHWPGRLWTPLYLELRPLVETFPALPSDEALPDMPDLATFETYLHGRLTAVRCETFFDDLISLLQAGSAAILLDGLDEVSDADDYRRRMQVQAFVAALQKAFDQAPIIVTARPYAYRLDDPTDPERWELAGFGYTTLIPFEPERQKEMARRLFNCLRPGDGQRAREFVAALASVPRDLPGNPLLLTLLAAVSVRRPHTDPHALPRTRGELYDRALTLLLEDWVKEHNERFSAEEDIGVDSKDLRLALQLVARRAQERSTQPNQAVIIQRGDFYDALDDIGKGETTPRLVRHLQWTAGMLLDLVEQAPGAMASPAPGRFRFLHLSFQEYLAACDMLYRPGTAYSRGRQIWDDLKFPDALAEQVRQKPRLWANVLRLAVDELLAKGRVFDAWELLALCCRPNEQEGADALGALLALQVTLDARLFEAAQQREIQTHYQALRDTALRVLKDHGDDGHSGLSPEQRDIAGQLLGSGDFPGHDTRKGVDVKDGLPDIDWVPISDDGSWTYQSKTHKPLDTYWIARYPITYAQFEVFLRAEDGYQEDRWWRGLDAPKDHRSSAGSQAFIHWNHPRERVSWWDAMAFCAWLTARAHDHPGLLPKDALCTGNWQITLPTEQQWEKAARGRDGRQYPWGGDEYKPGYANIDETIRKVGPHYLQKTTAVGMYPQGVSPYGVADLSGNVWEWCLNEYSSGKTDPGGNATRVLRGGSWDYDPDSATAPFCGFDHPGSRLNSRGFRVVVVGCALVPGSGL